jgi:hypothetical protein
MTHHRSHATLALAIIIACSSTTALARPGISCRHKTFPNLPGENAMVLARRGSGGYELTVQSYGKPKSFKVKCTFHDKDAGTFYCAQGSRRGFFCNRIRELSVTTDGKAQVFEGYTFQAVNAPLGQARPFMTLRFGREACRIGK